MKNLVVILICLTVFLTSYEMSTYQEFRDHQQAFPWP
jgi:hypothetical protein